MFQAPDFREGKNEMNFFFYSPNFEQVVSLSLSFLWYKTVDWMYTHCKNILRTKTINKGCLAKSNILHHVDSWDARHVVNILYLLGVAIPTMSSTSSKYLRKSSYLSMLLSLSYVVGIKIALLLWVIMTIEWLKFCKACMSLFHNYTLQ